MNSRITLVIMLNLLLHQAQAKDTLRIIYDRIEPLPVDKESKLQNLTLNILPSNNSFFQGEFVLIEDAINSKLRINIEVTRCLVGEAPDTCEFLINLKPPNLCILLNAENMAWNSITDAFTPRFRCPFKKGKYVADRASFDGNKWTIFPLDQFYFKFYFKVYEGDVLSMPAITECHFKRIVH